MRWYRLFVATTIATLAASTLTACAIGGPAGDGGKSLTFVSFGGAFQDNQKKAWQEPYTAATGIQFRNDGPTDEAKMKAMVDAGKVTWDVIDNGASAAAQYCGTYLEKLDFTVIDKNPYPLGTVNDCGVPAYFYATIFMYDTKKFAGNPPTNIADFFDLKKYPGKRIVPPEIGAGLLEYALLADGVPVDKLYPLDVDRALKKLDSIKSVTTFAKTYGQIQQAMVDGQADMALLPSSRAYQAIKAGASFAPVWDKTIVLWDDLIVPKGSPNKAEAMKFIAFTSQPPQSAKFSELASVQPVSAQIKPNFDPVQQQIDAFSDAHKPNTFYANADWWGQNLDAVTRKYTAWLAG
ncbi:ABC transporter substrate-binding protein [Saccharopolyspora sp. NPDC000995]